MKPTWRFPRSFLHFLVQFFDKVFRFTVISTERDPTVSTSIIIDQSKIPAHLSVLRRLLFSLLNPYCRCKSRSRRRHVLKSWWTTLPLVTVMSSQEVPSQNPNIQTLRIDFSQFFRQPMCSNLEFPLLTQLLSLTLGSRKFSTTFDPRPTLVEPSFSLLLTPRPGNFHTSSFWVTPSTLWSLYMTQTSVHFFSQRSSSLTYLCYP